MSVPPKTTPALRQILISQLKPPNGYLRTRYARPRPAMAGSGGVVEYEALRRGVSCKLCGTAHAT